MLHRPWGWTPPPPSAYTASHDVWRLKTKGQLPCTHKCLSLNVWHSTKDVKHPYLEVPATHTIITGQRTINPISLEVQLLHSCTAPYNVAFTPVFVWRKLDVSTMPRGCKSSSSTATSSWRSGREKLIYRSIMQINFHNKQTSVQHPTFNSCKTRFRGGVFFSLSAQLPAQVVFVDISSSQIIWNTKTVSELSKRDYIDHTKHKIYFQCAFFQKTCSE